MVELDKIEANKTENSTRRPMVWGRVLKGLLIADAAMALALTAGFVIPSTPIHDPETGALPERFYDYSAKISPFTPPEREARPPKAEVFKLTARGEHPTLVPVPAEPLLSENNTGDFASVVSTGSPAGSWNASAAVERRSMPLDTAVPARVESIDLRRTL